MNIPTALTTKLQDLDSFVDENLSYKSTISAHGLSQQHIFFSMIDNAFI